MVTKTVLEMDAEIQGLLAANNLQEFANDEGLPDFPQEGSQALDEYVHSSVILAGSSPILTSLQVWGR